MHTRTDKMVLKRSCYRCVNRTTKDAAKNNVRQCGINVQQLLNISSVGREILGHGEGGGEAVVAMIMIMATVIITAVERASDTARILKSRVQNP